MRFSLSFLFNVKMEVRQLNMDLEQGDIVARFVNLDLEQGDIVARFVKL